MGQHIQYNDLYIGQKIGSSNFSKNNTTISSAKHPDQLQTHPASKSSFFCSSKVASADNLTTHICLEPSLKISGVITPLSRSATMAQIGKPNFTFTSYLCTYFSRGHILLHFIKEPFLYITSPLHAHCMTHLNHLHWSNYINTMNSSNNVPHYTLLCVLQLLTPSIGQIFSCHLFFTVPQNTLFLQCERSHFPPIKMKGMFDLLVDDTFHFKWYCTCSESQNKDFLS
jgi:hypothetical protein